MQKEEWLSSKREKSRNFPLPQKNKTASGNNKVDSSPSTKHACFETFDEKSEISETENNNLEKAKIVQLEKLSILENSDRVIKDINFSRLKKRTFCFFVCFRLLWN